MNNVLAYDKHALKTLLHIQGILSKQLVLRIYKNVKNNNQTILSIQKKMLHLSIKICTQLVNFSTNKHYLNTL